MTDLSKYLDRGRALIERDRPLRVMQSEYDRMTRLEYELPAALQALQWIRLVKSSAPYDSLRGATRALASLDERLKIEPISVLRAFPEPVDPQSMLARTKANHWEQCLKWQMTRATQRRSISLRSDVILSAVKYDEICGQVIHLPTQKKILQQLGGNTNRWKALARMGDFAINLKNPQSVHAEYSPYGLEAVLCVEKWSARELRDTYGNAAPDPDDSATADCYVVFDWTDYDVHLVLAYPGESDDVISDVKPDSDNLITLLDAPNPYPFINWSCVIGGTGLDANPEHQRQPMLYPVLRTEQWITQNIAGTLAFSEGIAEMGRPKVKVTGPTPENVKYDFGEPGGRIELPPGHDAVDMDPRNLDPGLMQMWDRLNEAIATSTIARVLVTAESQSGESYSGFNLRVQTAIGALLPYKSLGERFFEGIYRTMLYWIHHTGTPVSGYSTNRKTLGELYTIKPSDIDPDQLYLAVELTPDVPTDRLQKINGALQLSQLGYPKTKVLEELGDTDPEGTLREGVREQMWMAAVQGKLQKIQAYASNQYQQEVMAAAQQMVAEQMAQLQAQQTQMAPPEFGEPDLAGLSGMEEAGVMPPMSGGGDMGGAGMAPPMGGMPPIGMMGDQATFEGANMESRALA